jgi:hypothetical protein
MNTVALSANLQAPLHHAASDRAKIAAEVAARLVELSKHATEEKVASWIQNMANLHRESGAEFFERIRLTHELTALLLEWADEIKEAEVGRWIRKVAIMHSDCAPALWVYLRLQTGDLTEITRSYSEQGEVRTRQKQAVQQELERVVACFDQYFPELGRAVRDLRRLSFDG